MTRTDRYDVVVVGGGAAGLSGALALARARRSVLVVDAGAPRNGRAAGVHGFLSRDGMPPAELLAVGRTEVEGFGGEVRTGEVVGARRTAEGFSVALADGSEIAARRLLVTTGLVDELPDVPGVAERWGRDVLHCPYCHGWEVRDQPIGVIGTGPMAVHQTLLFRQWTDDLVLFTHTGPQPTPEEAEQLDARGVAVIDGEIAALEVEGDAVTGVRMADGRVVARRAVVVGPRMIARGSLLADLGLVPAEHPMGVGVHIPAEAGGRTEAPGVWVAGNVTDLAAQVVTSAAAGLSAGAMINADLVAEETMAAVEAHRRSVA